MQRQTLGETDRVPVVGRGISHGLRRVIITMKSGAAASIRSRFPALPPAWCRSMSAPSRSSQAPRINLLKRVRQCMACSGSVEGSRGVESEVGMVPRPEGEQTPGTKRSGKPRTWFCYRSKILDECEKWHLSKRSVARKLCLEARLTTQMIESATSRGGVNA